MNKLSIIIPTFNRKNTLEHLLECLSTQATDKYEIIVVIDGSTDGTESMIKENHPRTHIVKGNGDWWWTRSINEGLKYAQNAGFKTFLLMNDDTFISSNYINQLLTHYRTAGNGVLGSISIDHSNSTIFDAGIYKNNWLTAKLYTYYKRGSEYNPSITNGIHPSLFLAGRGMLLNQKVIDTIGYFDENNFPQYMADYDFSHKAYLAGFPVNISWDTPVYSHINLTAAGNVNEKSFKKLVSSFFNNKSKQSITKNQTYYKRFAGWLFPISLLFHYSRTFASFFFKG